MQIPAPGEKPEAEQRAGQEHREDEDPGQTDPGDGPVSNAEVQVGAVHLFGPQNSPCVEVPDGAEPAPRRNQAPEGPTASPETEARQVWQKHALGADAERGQKRSGPREHQGLCPYAEQEKGADGDRETALHITVISYILGRSLPWELL